DAIRCFDLSAGAQAAEPRRHRCSTGQRIGMVGFRTMWALVVGVMLLAVVPASAEPATADDTAHFLAGMLPSTASPLTALTQEPAWQRHQRFFDDAFGQLEQRQLAKIHAWADANLAAPRPAMF